jgi:hypothetical protein
MTSSRHHIEKQEGRIMLWYNNPEAVQAIHDEMRRETRQVEHRRRLLRILAEPATESVPVD